MSKRNLMNVDNDSKSVLNRFAMNKPNPGGASILSKYEGENSANIDELKDIDENVGSKNIPVNRKNRNNLKNIEELPNKNLNIILTTKSQYTDLPIIGALKQSKKTSFEVKMEDGEDVDK